MFDDEQIQVTGTVTNIPVAKATVQNKDGYLVLSGKYGIFVYRDKGEWQGKVYDKVRVCIAYKGKDGKLYLQRNELKGKELDRKRLSMLERIGVRLELVAPLITLLSMVLKDIDIVSTESDISPQTRERIEEDADIDAILKKTGQII
jgi:hypothetical protein